MFPVSTILYHQSIYLHNFHLFDLFSHIPCPQSYLSDFFHHIICQYYLYISWKSVSPVSKLLCHRLIFLHNFHQSDIFHKIYCYQSYLSDLFHHIIFQCYTYFFWNSMFPVLKPLHHQLTYFHHFHFSDFFQSDSLS